MLFNSATVILPLLALSASVSALPPVARAPETRAVGTIPALLRHAEKGAHGLNPRQSNDDDLCDVGYHHCDGTEGCCQIGYYCGTWDGKRGCCPNGESCIANDDPCEYEDYFPCAGETFCCPDGTICYRDSVGAPQCQKSSGGGSTFTRTSTSLTRSFTSPSRTTTFPPSTAFTSADDDVITSRSTVAGLTTSSIVRNTNTGQGSLPTTSSVAENAFGNGAETRSVTALWLVAGAALNLFFI